MLFHSSFSFLTPLPFLLFLESLSQLIPQKQPTQSQNVLLYLLVQTVTTAMNQAEIFHYSFVLVWNGCIVIS